MPSSLLFATNSEGRVYTLPTSSAAWREFPYLGLEFKKVSAVSNFMWAIGGDRQVYVHVHGLDVPIRVKEESYENERWLPIEGFSKTLLPTDRYKFSSADGSAERSIDKIRLPSMAWQWDGDWHLDLDLDGQTLGEDGWMYALDFPATYSAKNSWNSYVRRRKWVRFRRYSAMNSWCAVAPLHKDPTQEPFIDVAVGGTNVPNAAAGTLIVWAITAHGRAMFRTGVSATAPEGLRWTVINTWPGNELAQISVGPTGLVWAVLYNGRVLVRTGVTRDNLSGVNWLEVKAPPSHTGSAAENNLKITQVSVGTNAVWCMTSDHRIWFRRGVKGEAAGISEEAATGNGWVEMIGNVSSISVAPNDQVFAVGSIDRALYFRTGVSASDLTGKKWRQLQCTMQISRTSSSMSIVSRKSGGSSTPGSKQQSFSNLYNKEKEKGVVEMVATIETVAHSSSSTSSGGGHTSHARFRNDLWKNSTDSPPNIGSLNLNERHKRRTAALRETTHASSAPATEIAEISGKSYETQLKNPRAWSPVRSVGSVVGMEAHPETDSAIFDADSTHHGSDVYLGEDDDHAGSQYWTECEVMWSCVAAGAVIVDPTNMPNWFNETSQSDNKVDTTSVWRKHIIDQLLQRQNMLNNLKDREKYEKAVKLSSWVKSAEGRYQRPDNEYEDCLIELEWVNASGGGTPTNSSGSDTGTFSILHPDGVTAIMQFSLSGITCVQCCSEPSAPRIAIHVQHLSNNCSPVRVQYATDAEMEDWLSHLSSVCCQINEVRGKPAKNAIWTTTDLGDVYVFDPISLKSHQWVAEVNRYVQRMDVTATETPYSNTLYNGMPCGAELEITGCVYDDADQIRFDLQCHAHVKSHEKLRVIAMHLNPRFNERTIVFNSMNDSEWLDEIRNDKMVFAPGATFALKLKAHETHYEIVVNDAHYTDYKYRAHPEAVSGLYVSGRVKLFNIVYKCPTVILSTQELFWRPMGGHVKRVFSCSAGVVWGMSCDNTAWVYNGGWGGSFLKGLESGSGKINTMIDTHIYYVYENQRWNPISGFTTKSLPTDRHMWSDATGRQKRSKEHTKLLSTHYEWISDWMIDYNIPGGADKEGWQYAIDFPASYHGQKRITDCVRRRRWMKRCRLMSSGPWQELSHSKILDASLQVLDDDADSANASEWDDRSIAAWAVASNGDVLTRYGVSAANPRGDSWEHIPSEQPLIAISVGPTGQVWVVGRNGVVFFRYGISKLNPHGDAWQQVEAPNGVTFKTVSVGKAGIWALDSRNRLAVRREVSKTFPEGSHWQFLPNVPNIPPHSESQLGFKSVSVGTEVWAVSHTGIICKRCGITKENPAGAGWNLGISGQWQHVSAEGFP